MKILPVFIPHLGCPFDCIYCDQKIITKTEVPELKFMQEQISRFCCSKYEQEKQIAFYGGTFTNLSTEVQQMYFELVKPFFSNCSIRISTRPDAVTKEKLSFCKQNNVEVIELGIQSFDDEVLKHSKRGYSSSQAEAACSLVKQFKFKLGIQLMPGLPCFTAESWQFTQKKTSSLKPDYLRIYPTIVMKGTKLEKLYQAGKYQPLSLADTIEFTADAVEKFQQEDINIIKLGLHSDIETDQIAAGPYHQAFGELVRAEILLRKIVNQFKPATLVISAKDVSLFKGFNCSMLNKLKSRLNLTRLPLIVDLNLEKSRFLFTEKSAQDYW